MVKAIVFGAVWCVVVYLVACMLLGAVAGAIAGTADPSNASVAGARAGAEVVSAYRLFLFLAAAAMAMLGTWAQILPGTKRSRVTVADFE